MGNSSLGNIYYANHAFIQSPASTNIVLNAGANATPTMSVKPSVVEANVPIFSYNGGFIADGLYLPNSTRTAIGLGTQSGYFFNLISYQSALIRLSLSMNDGTNYYWHGYAICANNSAPFVITATMNTTNFIVQGFQDSTSFVWYLLITPASSWNTTYFMRVRSFG